MSDFYNPPTQPKANKNHRCVYCWHIIPKGEVHKYQTGNYDGAWFRNRFHVECWDELCKEDRFEFFPGDGEPPERLKNFCTDLKG